MQTIKTAGMEIEIYSMPTAVGNWRTYCVVTYADGHVEYHAGKVFPTKAEADQHADSLTEALRETQTQAQGELS